MDIKKIIFVWVLLFTSSIALSEEQLDSLEENEKLDSLLDYAVIKKDNPFIPFSFKNEPITNIVNILARYKQINILEPIDERYRKLTVSFENDEYLTLDDAWNFLQTFLKLGGYALTLRGDQYSIVQRDPSRQVLQKEVLPLYINVEPDELPFTDAPIRAMFFLENLALGQPTTAGGGGPADDIVSQILKDILSPGSIPIIDAETKSIVLTDNANLISSAMKIIYALDRSGVRESVEIVPLYNTSAGIVSLFLTTGLGISGATGPQQPGYLSRTQRAEGHPYFSPNTAIVPDNRSNSLILLGREANVDRLKQFIEEYIDVPPDKGESILHTYDLQYLESKQTQIILTEVLAAPGAPPAAVASGQSEAATIPVGPERYFQNPVIIAEEYAQVTQADTIGTGITGLPGYQNILRGDVQEFRPYQGGNKLIIAALRHDWERIEELLKKIDQPTEQVIIEALVVDCQFSDDRFLRGAIRNPQAMGLQEGQSFQSQNLPVIPSTGSPNPNALVYEGGADTATPGTDLSVDLLKSLAQSSDNTLASFAGPGTLFISFDDPFKSGIWGLIEIFKDNQDFKILQHPHVVTASNRTAFIGFAENRRAIGSVGYGAGGALTTPVVNFTAQLALSVTPRTSSADRVNLTVAIENSDFPNNNPAVTPGEATNFFDTRVRALGTNINMSNNQAVALGGLINTSTTNSETQTPFLARIPFFGTFFRGSSKSERKTSLVIFLSARVVRPRGMSHTKQFTDEKLSRVLYHLDDYDLFTSLQDPITRFFFKKEYDEKHAINDFLLETQQKMLDPNTYSHEPCNDAKMAGKIEFIERTSAGGVKYQQEFEQIKKDKLDQLKEEKLKEMLARENNPLLRDKTDNEVF